MRLPARPIDGAEIGLYARMALEGIQRESPHYLETVWQLGGRNVAGLSPRDITPAFYGCYDWHSAVHSHWSLIRLLRCCPGQDWEEPARAAISQNITPEHIEREVTYFSQPGLQSFERPYGLAWLMTLVAELHTWNDAQGNAWLAALQPLASLARQRFMDWFPTLPAPIRTGEHGQTAFAMGLLLDAAWDTGDEELGRLVKDTALRFHRWDRNANPRLEPSGYDFLSPTLAAADLMGRVLGTNNFSQWLAEHFVERPNDLDIDWLAPAVCGDAADGKLCHLDGLNLSRAWMLEGILEYLPPRDGRRRFLADLAELHRTLGLSAIRPDLYSGAHWLGTFAVYLLTQRGLPENSLGVW